MDSTGYEDGHPRVEQLDHEVRAEGREPLGEIAEVLRDQNGCVECTAQIKRLINIAPIEK